MNLQRRALFGRVAGLGLAATLPGALSTPVWAQAATSSSHRFDPQTGDWRSFDVTTRVDLPATRGVTRVWVPLPTVQTGWQVPVTDAFTSNGKARITTDGHQGVRMVAAEFPAGVAQPFVEVTSRVRTQSRVEARQHPVREDAATLRQSLQPTHLLPTDGIVRETALKATRGARGDEAKARAIYDWVVANAWREPKVKGCGEGDMGKAHRAGSFRIGVQELTPA